MDRYRKLNALTFKKLQKMPVNLRKKAVREARNRNEKILGRRKQRKRIPRELSTTPRRLRNDFDRSEHNAMLASTSQELRRILESCDTLSDIPHDITPTELMGEVRGYSRRSKGCRRSRVHRLDNKYRFNLNNNGI